MEIIATNNNGKKTHFVNNYNDVNKRDLSTKGNEIESEFVVVVFFLAFLHFQLLEWIE